MEPIQQVSGRAYPWGAKNIDTDIIIPAHWLKTTTREGLGKGAFESVRAEPDNLFDDPRYAGADSGVLLARVRELIEEKGYRVGNVDATVVAQRPKLMAYIPQMVTNIARILAVPEDAVNVKATTEEKLGFTGSGEGISAYAVAGIESKEKQ